MKTKFAVGTRVRITNVPGVILVGGKYGTPSAKFESPKGWEGVITGDLMMRCWGVLCDNGHKIGVCENDMIPV